MIPKIIHYCWFGKKKKPAEVEKYIKNWKKMLPNYKIIEWNEENFDIGMFQYTKEAYENKKYAFVSDVARIKALYDYGGIYLDTDIEIKKDFSNLLKKYDLIMGYELNGKHLMTAFIAAAKNNIIMKKLLDIYANEKFINDDDSLNVYPNTYRITELLKKQGIKIDGKFQTVDNIALFPEKTFSAMEFSTMKEISDETTYTVHHFKSSWKPWYVKLRRKIKIFLLSFLKKDKERNV